MSNGVNNGLPLACLGAEIMLGRKTGTRRSSLRISEFIYNPLSRLHRIDMQPQIMPRNRHMRPVRNRPFEDQGR